MRLSLEEYALRLAAAASCRSEDPKRQVGATILGVQGQVLALGYNGPPPGIDLKPWEWVDRQAKALLTIHAEANALRWIRPGEGVLLASTYGPCCECIRTAAAQGITKIVYRVDSPDREDAQDVAGRLGIDIRKV